MWGNIQFYACLWFLLNEHYWFALISYSLITTKLPLCGSAMAVRLERGICLCTLYWSMWIHKECLGGNLVAIPLWLILLVFAASLLPGVWKCIKVHLFANASICTHTAARRKLTKPLQQFSCSEVLSRMYINSIPGTWGMVPAPAPRVCVNINVPVRLDYDQGWLAGRRGGKGWSF